MDIITGFRRNHFGGEKDKNKKTFGTSNILFSESNFAICVAYRLNYR